MNNLQDTNVGTPLLHCLCGQVSIHCMNMNVSNDELHLNKLSWCTRSNEHYIITYACLCVYACLACPLPWSWFKWCAYMLRVLAIILVRCPCLGSSSSCVNGILSLSLSISFSSVALVLVQVYTRMQLLVTEAVGPNKFNSEMPALYDAKPRSNPTIYCEPKKICTNLPNFRVATSTPLGWNQSHQDATHQILHGSGIRVTKTLLTKYCMVVWTPMQWMTKGVWCDQAHQLGADELWSPLLAAQASAA